MHLAWFTTLEHKGKDLYPVLHEKIKDRKGGVYESDPVRYDMMMHFGAFITESSGHLSEYLPYYRKNQATLREYCRDGCVEVECLVDRNGIHPTRYGALPPQMAHICASNMVAFDQCS